MPCQLERSLGVMARRRLLCQYDAEPDTSIVKLATDLIALRDGAMRGPVVEASATEHLLLAGAPVGRAVPGNHIDIAYKRVLAPFPDVARHVEDPELVRCFLCDGLRVITVSTIV